MKIRYEFIKREIVGEFFLIPVGEAAKKYSGMFALNEIGAFIWDILPTAETEEDIVKKITEEYEVSEETAAADTAEFLGKLKDMGIL